MKKYCYVALSLVIIAFFYKSFFRYPHHIGLADWDLALANTFSHIKALYQHGTVLLWNPWICGGKDGFAITGAQEFNFVSFFYLFFPFALSTKLNILFYFFLAFIAFYLYSRKIVGNHSLFPALIVSILYCFNGAITAHLKVGHLLFIQSCLFPFVFLFLELYFKEKKILYIALASLFFSWIVYMGVSYPIIHIFSLTSVYLLMKLLIYRDRSALKAIFYFTIFTFLFSGLKLLLTYDQVSGATYARKEFRESFPIFGIWKSLISEKAHRMGGWGWHERNFYIGYAGVFLFIGSLLNAAIKIFRMKIKNTELIYIVLGILSLLMIMGGYYKYSLYRLMYKLPLFNSMHVTGRWFFPLLLSCSLLLLYFLKDLEEIKIPRYQSIFSKLKLTLFIGLGFYIAYDLHHTQKKKIKAITLNYMPWIKTLDSFDPKRINDFKVFLKGNKYRYRSSSSLLPMVAKQETSRRCYAPLNKRRKGVVAGKELLYFPKEKKSETGNSISNIKFTPNKITFDTNLKTEKMIALNQNFSTNWHFSDEKHHIEKYKNKPAITLKPGKYNKLSFYFWPKHLSLGLLLLAFGFLSLICLIFQELHLHFKKKTKLKNISSHNALENN